MCASDFLWKSNALILGLLYYSPVVLVASFTAEPSWYDKQLKASKRKMEKILNKMKFKMDKPEAKTRGEWFCRDKIINQKNDFVLL